MVGREHGAEQVRRMYEGTSSVEVDGGTLG